MQVTFETFGLKSPYTRFNKSEIEPNIAIPNWQYADSLPTFASFIGDLRPPLIIELGSWLGWSAVEMAKICKNLNLDCKILCVDTWLGSQEHWRADLCASMGEFQHFENGTSTVFDKFCRHVISNGVDDVIIPLPNTTNMMYKLFKFYGITSKLIYVDASHETDDVVNDLVNYWNLLENGGRIFGDDVCWASVQDAISIFSERTHNCPHYSTNKQLYYFNK